MGAHILIVEDEEKLARFVELELVHEGYEVTKCTDGREALDTAESGQFDLILLDIMLPELNGLEVLRRLRKTSEVPVILLTAKSEEQDEIDGLNYGADEYVTKPFSPRTLVARVDAMIRRSGAYSAGAAAAKEQDTADPDILRAGGIIVDKAAHTVTLDGVPVELSFKEFELLAYFMENSGIALSREKILNNVWDYDYYGDSRTVDTHVKKLRAKLGGAGEMIQTVWGLGYKFLPTPSV